MFLALLQARGIPFDEPDPGGDFDPPDLAWTDDLIGLALHHAPSDNTPAAALAALLLGA